MHKMLVLDMETGNQIGTGLLICDSTGKMYDPTLMGSDGESLPAAWYNLKITDEQWLVVVPTRIQ